MRDLIIGGWTVNIVNPLVQRALRDLNTDLLHADGLSLLGRHAALDAVTTAFGAAMLAHYFENANHANVGDATGLVASSVAGVFWHSLHSATPGVGGNQTTNENSVTGYARRSLARSTSGYTASGLSCVNDGTLTFGQASSGSEACGFMGLGSDETSNGNLFMFLPLDSSFTYESPINPEFGAGTLDFTAA